MLHKEYGGIGEVIDMEKFPVGAPAAPERYMAAGNPEVIEDAFRIASGIKLKTDRETLYVLCYRVIVLFLEKFSEVEFAHQRRQNMGGFEIEVVMAAV
jgi:hypothetical protein